MTAKRRDILDKRARDMLIRVNDYFEAEKVQSKNILKTLNSLLKDSAGKLETVISRQLLLEITAHLKKNNSVTECVVKATGVNKNTVCVVRGERAHAVATGTEMATPRKRPRGKKQFLDSSGLSALRSIINSYKERREVLTLNKILAVARKDLVYSGSKSTLRRILKEDLGYRFNKCTTKSVLLMKPQIQLKNGVEDSELPYTDCSSSLPVNNIHELLEQTMSTD